jgi:2-polyprenyl-6-methoxyphenol hydroxylase-like FAD-dependent oxidoreductase
MSYDVIVVGTRVGGAATAMLLARRGLRVLAVDRARFPSDTLSTHQVQAPAIARLGRWGLLDRLAGAPPTRDVRLDAGSAVLHGSYPGDLHSPRRTVLDAMLVAAAREAGAEVREGFAVDELMWDADRVVGIRGRVRGGAGAVEERAPLVVGADGKRSFVANAVGAGRYRVRPAQTFAAYAYFAGVPLPVGEIYLRPGRMVPAFATNDGLSMICVFGPMGELDAYRADPDGYFAGTLDGCGDLGERVRAGERAERFRAAPDVTNGFRVPNGPGWALVGDAGLVMDPVGAQGIANAFRDAEALAEAVVSGDFATYQRDRDAAVGAMYDLVGDFGRLRMSVRERLLIRSIAGQRAEVDRFLAVLAGSEPAGPYLRPSAVLRRLVVSTTRRRSEEAGWTRSTSPAGSSGSPPSTTSCSFP